MKTVLTILEVIATLALALLVIAFGWVLLVAAIKAAPLLTLAAVSVVMAVVFATLTNFDRDEEIT